MQLSLSYSSSFRVCAAALAMALVLGIGPAWANPQMELLGATDSTLPFSGSVRGEGASATYLNPALLLFMEPGTSFGLIAVGQGLDINYHARPEGIDITEAIFDARELQIDGSSAPPTLRPLPTSQLRNARGSHEPTSFHPMIAMGASQHFLHGDLALGFYALLPIQAMEAQSPFFSDEREQYFSNSLHFELLEDQLEGSTLSFAMAGRLWKSMALGIGLTMNSKSSAVSDVFIGDAAYQAGAYIVPRVEVKTTWTPHLGLIFDPPNPMRVSATLHFKNQNQVDARSQVQFWNYPYKEGQSSIDQEVSLGYRTLPLRAQIGFLWDARNGSTSGWGAACSAAWTQWSEYHTRYGESPALPWKDTLSLNLGGSYGFHTQELGLDLRYQPSPVPEQNGRSNYVDNDRLATSMGWQLKLPWASSLGIQFQLHYLLPRTTSKSADSPDPVLDEFPDSVDIKTDDPMEDSVGFQTNNPGYPGYESSGMILVGSLYYKLQF